VYLEAGQAVLEQFLLNIKILKKVPKIENEIKKISSASQSTSNFKEILLKVNLEGVSTSHQQNETSQQMSCHAINI
jgi:hypothetical protein